MKIKNKILLIFSFILLFLVLLNTDSFAATNIFEEGLYSKSEDLMNNLIIPDEYNDYIYLISKGLSETVEVFLINPDDLPDDYLAIVSLSIDSILTSSTNNYYVKFYDSSDNLITLDYINLSYTYTSSDDFSTLELSSTDTSSSSQFLVCRQLSAGTFSKRFVSSNIDIYDEDRTTKLFQVPVEIITEMMGLVPLETIQVTQVQEKIAETLKVIVPIALMVFSALLSPFLIRYLIFLKK